MHKQINKHHAPRGFVAFTDKEKAELLPYHNKGMNARQVFIEINGREPTPKELDKTRKIAIKQGITLNSRKSV